MVGGEVPSWGQIHRQMREAEKWETVREYWREEERAKALAARRPPTRLGQLMKTLRARLIRLVKALLATGRQGLQWLAQALCRVLPLGALEVAARLDVRVSPAFLLGLPLLMLGWALLERRYHNTSEVTNLLLAYLLASSAALAGALSLYGGGQGRWAVFWQAFWRLAGARALWTWSDLGRNLRGKSRDMPPQVGGRLFRFGGPGPTGVSEEQLEDAALVKHTLQRMSRVAPPVEPWEWYPGVSGAAPRGWLFHWVHWWRLGATGMAVVGGVLRLLALLAGSPRLLGPLCTGGPRWLPASWVPALQATTSFGCNWAQLTAGLLMFLYASYYFGWFLPYRSGSPKYQSWAQRERQLRVVVQDDPSEWDLDSLMEGEDVAEPLASRIKAAPPGPWREDLVTLAGLRKLLGREDSEGYDWGRASEQFEDAQFTDWLDARAEFFKNTKPARPLEPEQVIQIAAAVSGRSMRKDDPELDYWALAPTPFAKHPDTDLRLDEIGLMSPSDDDYLDDLVAVQPPVPASDMVFARNPANERKDIARIVRADEDSTAAKESFVYDSDSSLGDDMAADIAASAAQRSWTPAGLSAARGREDQVRGSRDSAGDVDRDHDRDSGGDTNRRDHHGGGRDHVYLLEAEDEGRWLEDASYRDEDAGVGDVLDDPGGESDETWEDDDALDLAEMFSGVKVEEVAPKDPRLIRLRDGSLAVRPSPGGSQSTQEDGAEPGKDMPW